MMTELDILLMLGLATKCRSCGGTGTKIITVTDTTAVSKRKRTWVEFERLVECDWCDGKGGWDANRD